VIPQLPAGLDATYTFTQSLPVSANAAIVTVALILLVGFVAWCFAWAYVEGSREESKRALLPWPPLTRYLPPEHPMCGSRLPDPPAPKKRRKKGKKP
jgi:hypothetical protein